MKQQPVDIRSFLHAEYVSDPQFSPDGRYISYTVTTVSEKENKYLRDLWLYDRKTKRTRRMSDRGDIGHVTWTKGRTQTLLFSAVRTEADKKRMEDKEEYTVFYEMRPDGGEALRAFEVPAEGASIAKVLPDGSFLMNVSYDVTRPRRVKDGGTFADKDKEFDKAFEEWKKEDRHILTETPFWFNGQGITEGQRSVLALYDRKKNKLTKITTPEMNAGLVRACGDLIAFNAAPPVSSLQGKAKDQNGKVVTPLRPEVWFDGLYVYNRKTGKTKELIAPFTKDVFLLDFLDEHTLLVHYTDYKTNPLQFGSFYTCDIRTGALKKRAFYEASLGPSLGSDLRQGGGKWMHMDAAGNFTLISTVEDGTILRRLAPDGKLYNLSPSGDLQPLQKAHAGTEDYAVEGFDILDGHLVTSLMREGEIADLYLDGKRITRHGERFAKKYALQKPEKLFFKNKDGVEIHGWCLKPARFRKNGHYPAILHIHGGPATVFGNVPHHEMQLWAAKGYFVFYCNPRGSDGRGNDFINISGKYGSIDYEDIMAFTDRVLKAYPMIDRTRVGVTGGSYGGFMTNWIIGHTNRFACACAQRSICNWITFEHTSDIGPVFTKLQQGAYTRDNMKSLWDKSPLKYADKAVTPTLFVCGDEDYRCYYADSVSMFTALQENGTPAKIALFHGENHELSRSGKPKNRIARMQEILDWMDHWLK